MAFTQFKGWSKVAADPVVSQDIYTYSTVQMADYGARLELADGRVYRYCSNGTAGALAAGTLLQSAASVHGTDNVLYDRKPYAAATARATSVQVVTTTGGVAANQFAGGYMGVQSDGQMYRISGNSAASAAAATTVKLDDELRVALTTSSEVQLVQSPYKGVITAPTTLTGNVCGVAPIIVPQSTTTTTYYFWAQTYGPCSVKAGHGATAIPADSALSCPGSVVGTFDLRAAAATTAKIGKSLDVIATTQTLDFVVIFLQIAA